MHIYSHRYTAHQDHVDWLNFLTTLQAATGEQYPTGGNTASDSVSKTLHIQAAKVVAAHAASVGDNLLAVPLLCSAGVNTAHELPAATLTFTMQTLE